MDPAVLRILDVNVNRSREALRVIEDYARFALDDLDAAAERLKAIYMAEQCKTNRLRDSLKQFMNE